MMSSLGRRVPIWGAAALLVCVLQMGVAEARSRKPSPQATPSASATFMDEQDCVAKGALAAADCHNAALNSHAEYEEKAPRLSSNDACTRFFGAHNCSMRIGAGLQGIGFLPSYRGFRLVQGKGAGEMMTLPVIAGTDSGIGFTSRPVSRLDTELDGARGARAQAAWQSAHAPVIRSARGGAIPYREAPKGVAPDPSDDEGMQPSGPAASYPVSPAKLKAMQEEMRKYGTPPPAVK